MFKKNTAVTGFGIGHFINTTTGAAVTTGTPTCKRTIDGTGGSCANAASYNSGGAVWEIDLADTDMNGSVIILSFTLTDCLPISYTIKTSQVDVDDAVHFGITALPNATPGSNGGLPTTNGTKVNQTVDLTAGQTIGANMTKIMGADLVETKSAGGSIAAGVSYFFDVDTPTKDMEDLGGTIELTPEAAEQLALDISTALIDQPDGGTGKIKVTKEGKVIVSKAGIY